MQPSQSGTSPLAGNPGAARPAKPPTATGGIARLACERVRDAGIDVDPLLKDPANGDYHLTPASPAVDAAGETGTPDFDGTARPQGAQSDMGAFELVP